MSEVKKTSFIENAWNALISNVETRTNFLRQWFEPGRNIEQECGHPLVYDITDGKKAFLRDDIAKRVVTLYPEESWETPPMIYETEDESETAFEKAWKELDKRLHLNALFVRADILSGIGRYGVILLGVNDGLSLEIPIPGIDLKTGEAAGATTNAAPTGERKLMYLRCFDETFIQIRLLNNDPTSPRFGLPDMYSIEFAADQLQGARQAVPAGQQTQMPSAPGTTSRRDVHWTRVIHLADNRLNNDIYGTPRMEIVYNRLLDLKKITGGSGEMFWKGGFPGLSLEAQVPTDGAPVQFDKEQTKEEVEKYMKGLQRYLALIGMQAKSLTVQVADPKPHADIQLTMIAIALACPLRVFMGSEQAQLASGQDIISWNDRMMRRRDTYISPFILHPFIQRLQAIGVLPETSEDGVTIEWDDMNAIERASQRATYAMNQTSALTAYISAGGDQLVPPFEYLTLIMGMTDEEARTCIENTTALIETDPMAEHAKAVEMIQAKANANATAAKAAGLNGRGAAAAAAGNNGFANNAPRA
jgi:hypothetical protein